ncbi:MAG: response regulator [Hyphomicrobium sp.]
MSETQLAAMSGSQQTYSDDISGEAQARATLVPVISVLAAAGTVLLALFATQASEPLLLTLMASLAMLGVFFVFGLMAGHIRIGERIRYDDLVAAFTENLDSGLLLTGRDGTIHFANTRYGDMAGRSPSGEPQALDVAFGGDAAAAEAMFRLTRAASRGQTWREDFEIRTKNSGSQHLSVSCKPLSLDAHAREMGPLVSWTITDITAERTGDLGRLAGLQAVAGLYDQSPVGFLSIDAGGVVRHANATFLNWIGRHPEAGTQPRGLKIADLLPQDGIDLLRQAALGAANGVQSIDLDVTARDGRLLAMRFVVQRDAHGGPQGGLNMGVLNREMGASLSAEEGAEARFARLFQSAPFGIAAIRSDGRITSANSAFARMSLPGAGGIGDQALDVLAYNADAQTRRELDGALTGVLTGQSNPLPLEITTGANNELSRRVYISSLAHGKSDSEAAIVFVLDATEQKALEAKFAQSSKMEAVGQLAGGIAHDFNNVLTAIIGYSDLLLQTHRPADPAYKDIKNIQTSAYRAAEMVRQLLSFSRRQPLQAVPLQLGELIADKLDMLKKSAGDKVEFTTQPSRDLWYVKADRTELERVILNLSTNAGHAMPDGGTLTVRTSNITERQSQKLAHHGMPVGEYVLMEVADSGTGMSPEVLAKIFEPFFTTKAVGKGSGLGLSNVYGIIKQSSGFIYADSAPGRGTTFRIYLPRYLPENDEEVVSLKDKDKKKTRTADLTGTGRVLLVEDEDIVRSFAVRALKRQGYEVLEASSGVEALEVMAANEGRIDIVVSDVVMPEMDGPAMAKELRKKNPDLKIIFVSGYPREHFDTSLDKDQHFAFLPKPFSLPQLAAKVKEQLQSEREC